MKIVIADDNAIALKVLRAALLRAGHEVRGVIDGQQALDALADGECRLVIAVPENGSIRTIADLSGTTIATSYPHLLGDFLRTHKANTLYLIGDTVTAQSSTASAARSPGITRTERSGRTTRPAETALIVRCMRSMHSPMGNKECTSAARRIRISTVIS